MAVRSIPKSHASQKSDQQLGTLIATVLNHPDLPEGVYNSIGDALAELQSRPGMSTRPEWIQAVIDGHNELEKIDITLVSCGNNKIETIKTVKEFTGLSLQEAKGMVDRVPSILKGGVNKEEAEAIKKKLGEQGCRIGTTAHEKGGAQ